METPLLLGTLWQAPFNGYLWFAVALANAALSVGLYKTGLIGKSVLSVDVKLQ